MIGVGKTRLAVATLRTLLTERGAQGVFYDYRELLKQIQHSYNAGVAATELEILQPFFDAEVLVLDEIGASKPSVWVWDTVAYILNTPTFRNEIRLVWPDDLGYLWLLSIFWSAGCSASLAQHMNVPGLPCNRPSTTAEEHEFSRRTQPLPTEI